MSKERELLKECRLMLDNPINGTAGRNLQIKITELLAQPEALSQVVDSDETASSYLDARLWEFIDMSACFPKAKPDPRIWDHVLIYAPKPEQAEQEPVAWQYRCQLGYEEGRLTWCGCSEDDYLAYQTPDMFENVTYETRKLYTSPPKREPLTMSTAIDTVIGEHVWYIDGFTDGILYAEEHHGIMVDV